MAQESLRRRAVCTKEQLVMIELVVIGFVACGFSLAVGISMARGESFSSVVIAPFKFFFAPLMRRRKDKKEVSDA